MRFRSWSSARQSRLCRRIHRLQSASIGTMAPTGGPFSKILGSVGGGPSIAHRLLSYFDRINDSILLRVRSNTCSHSLIWWDMTRFEMSLPVHVGKSISPFLNRLKNQLHPPSDHPRPSALGSRYPNRCFSLLWSESPSEPYTPLLICVPMDLCIPEHLIHKNTPL